MTDTYNDGKCNGILENLSFSQQNYGERKQGTGQEANSNLPGNY